MFGNTGGSDVTRETLERTPHALSRLNMPPPAQSVCFSSVCSTLGLDSSDRMGKRSLIERSILFAHFPAEVDYPLVRRTAGKIATVHPWAQHVCIRPTIWVERHTEPLARQ